ncbi:tumor necrosis factor receptor type 1-associated DEATH domain protein-like isoform X2 [Polyodon spathula]|uniref:tumor necrosis factor receptor type 1-associated DEATH domain protein-like isoform X2 n=1 Tax=Polyodon spathula TaxID=7913 RepID=UPI001B7DD9F2|nr:tumor necrosis factor receptor type 1-associated DEATH domain protein-like isoform X2 [Polyodon spathula]XP_041124999.1 tumor necrosis factor receptor type 1-associated DEATH domain protein-like isoform X2 [Polyodon spathula]
MEKLTSSSGSGGWAGSAFLFLQSNLQQVDLPALYKNPEQKINIFKALKLTLSDSLGGLDGYEILKIHNTESDLIIQIKFSDEMHCTTFLESYASAGLKQCLGQHLRAVLSVTEELEIDTKLKTGRKTLDDFLKDRGRCLRCIKEAQPDRLRDDEVAQLEKTLQSLMLNNRHPSEAVLKGFSSSSSSLNSREEGSLLPSNSFKFQGRVYDDRRLTSSDHQKFAFEIGKQWKKVARSLQKGCRALKDPAIDNLAYEFDKDGLYEQAYQMLNKFLQSEGKKAKLSRLISALEENGLMGIAERMLDIQPAERQ